MIEKIKNDMKSVIESNDRQVEKLRIENTCFSNFIEVLNSLQKENKNVKYEVNKFIKELELIMNKNDNFGIFGVSCNYVIERLKDIIK